MSDALLLLLLLVLLPSDGGIDDGRRRRHETAAAKAAIRVRRNDGGGDNKAPNGCGIATDGHEKVYRPARRKVGSTVCCTRVYDYVIAIQNARV